jgi:hypothetical protein
VKSVTIWLKQPDVTLYVGGNLSKGQHPVITAVIEKPQILVDADKNTITIIETK